MFYASAYPNSAISAGAMTAIAVVMVGVLTFWLVMVYIAAREPGKPRPTGQRSKAGDHAPVTAPDDLVQDEHKETVLRG